MKGFQNITAFSIMNTAQKFKKFDKLYFKVQRLDSDTDPKLDPDLELNME